MLFLISNLDLLISNGMLESCFEGERIAAIRFCGTASLFQITRQLEIDSVEFLEIIIPFEIEEKLIWKHNVHAYEVEEVFQSCPHVRFVERGNIRGEDLYVASGQTDTGRHLSIFFINKGRGVALVISARDMDKKERERYGKVRKK